MKPETLSDNPGAKRQALWTVLACAAILIVGIAARSNSFKGPFIFDDSLAIRDNPTLRHFPAWDNFVPPHASPVSRRPVANLTLALNYAVGGLDVRGFHAVNLLIHLLNALLIFGIVRRTLATSRPASSIAVAFAVALIWSVHPLLTEPVNYLTQRTELLVGFCYLLTLYCFIRAASIASSQFAIPNSQFPIRNSQLPISNCQLWYAAAIAACALGMAAKEVMVTAPIVVLLYDQTFLSGSFREALRRRWPLYLGLAATWTILGALLVAYPLNDGPGGGTSPEAVAPWAYARTQPGVILNYLRLSFWPSSLCLDYSWPIATSARQIIPAAAVIAALLAGTLWALRRAPALGFFGAWFFLILTPTSSFMPLADPAFEHRMYLPLAAIVTACVLAAWRLGNALVRRVTESAATRRLLGSVLAAVALLSATAALGYRTFERNAQYRDAISLWQDTVKQRPWNSRAQNNLGMSYLDAGRPDEAIRCFNKAIELNPDYLKAYNNRGSAFLGIHRFAEAAQDLDKAIELNSAYANGYNTRAYLRLSTGQYNEALADCDKAIALQPGFADAYNNRGIALARMNRLAEAVRDYDKAIALNPDYAEAYSNRGAAYAGAGRVAEALQDYSRAIALQPDNARAYNNRAVVGLNTGRYNEALADCDKAIALQPGYANAYLNRAYARYQMKEYDQALSDLNTCEQLGGRPDPKFIGQLLHAAGQTK